MASIRKRGRKWQVQIRRKGYPLFARTFQEKTVAIKWARRTESDLDKGLHPHTKTSSGRCQSKNDYFA
ncbi:MAG: hypothetical protein ACI82H_001748 [Alphaproteobacteria bacterium]|jgi:hypothetical protein